MAQYGLGECCQLDTTRYYQGHLDYLPHHSNSCVSVLRQTTARLCTTTRSVVDWLKLFSAASLGLSSVGTESWAWSPVRQLAAGQPTL